MTGGLRPDASERVLWDVVEEHLDEAEFLFEQFERALESATLPIERVASGVESRLLAHLDGLLVGGSAVWERLIAPVLAKPDPAQPARVAVGSLVAIRSGHPGAVPIGHPDAAVREAAVRAFALTGSLAQTWALRLWELEAPRELRSSLLALFASLGVEPQGLSPWLRDADPRSRRAAAQAARYGRPERWLGEMDRLLADEDADTREAALLAALSWGSARAQAACRAWALDPAAPHALPMLLFSIVAGPEGHDRLAAQLERRSHVQAALFALGYSGDAGVLPALEASLGDGDPRVARLAAQAISTITGLDLEEPPYIRPSGPDGDEPDDALPPLEEEVPDLTPAPEDSLPLPDAEAIRRFCDAHFREAPRATRWLGGKPLSASVALEYLARAPMRRRHAVALMLEVRQGVRVDTRAWTRDQTAQTGAGAPRRPSR